jgi:hypothetical protein
MIVASVPVLLPSRRNRNRNRNRLSVTVTGSSGESRP